eukprot:XP_001704826.1 Hypothetical protein GL50803_38616 [Giardia lamblia ATCC 50803]
MVVNLSLIFLICVVTMDICAAGDKVSYGFACIRGCGSFFGRQAVVDKCRLTCIWNLFQ